MRPPSLLSILLLAARVEAAPPPVTDPAYLRAAVVVSAFERLAEACRAQGGFAPAQQSLIADWQAAHKVELIRRRLPELEAHPGLRQQVDTAAQHIVAELARQKLQPCPAATSLTRLPQAWFAEASPELLMTDDAPVPAPSPPPAAASATAPSAALAAIDSIGFHTRPKMGMGGFIMLDVFPVLLLRSGELVKDVAALREPGGLPAHRAAHPADWAQWRRVGGKLELKTEKGWAPLGFQKTYQTLPAGLVLNGRFRATGGSGNLAIGGTDSVVAWDAYRFTPDGQVERTGGAGASAAFGNTAVTTRSDGGSRPGRYHIEGLTLHIDYDDGGHEQRVLIVDPANPGGALWLDGEAYVQRK